MQTKFGDRKLQSSRTYPAERQGADTHIQIDRQTDGW